MNRAMLSRPLSPAEKRIVEMLAERDYSNREIGEALGVKAVTAKNQIERIGLKIPGTLPAKMRVTMWARGAPLEVLNCMSPSGKPSAALR